MYPQTLSRILAGLLLIIGATVTDGQTPPAPPTGFTYGSASVPNVDAIQGYAAGVTGGAGQTTCTVTNTNASGAGSLEACAISNRNVVFSVSGTITRAGDLVLSGVSNLTIDGSTAPSPGITVTGGGALSITSGSNNILVRGLRWRNGSDDCMRVFGSTNVAFDHVSVGGCQDGGIDVTETSSNVTIQWSILHHPDGVQAGATLVKYETDHVTIHHNLYESYDRSPLCSGRDGVTTTSTTMCDVRNNFMWGWGDNNGANFGSAIQFDHGAHGNAVKNWLEAYGTYPTLQSLAILINHNGTGAQLYTSGNDSGSGATVNSGNAGSPFSAPAITEDATAKIAACRVLNRAGVSPRDTFDTNMINAIISALSFSMATCP